MTRGLRKDFQVCLRAELAQEDFEWRWCRDGVSPTHPHGWPPEASLSLSGSEPYISPRTRCAHLKEHVLKDIPCAFTPSSLWNNSDSYTTLGNYAACLQTDVVFIRLAVIAFDTHVQLF